MDATLGEVAAAVAAEMSLPACCSSLLVFRVDGDAYPHDTKLGSEALDLEEGMQLDILLPHPQGPLPHHHGSQKPVVEEQKPLEVATDDAVALDDGSVLILD